MKLLCAISHHGLGHLAQTAPVLQAMNTLRPDLEWVIWSGHDRPVLEARLDCSFTHRQEATDIGLVMHDAMRVDEAASLQALREFHRGWDARVAQTSRWLVDEGIQGVVSNVGYLPLQAAAAARLRTVAFCSLNWWDITRHYLGHMADIKDILAQIQAAYHTAQLFLKPAPSMPMDWLPRSLAAPPVATLGQNRRKELTQRLSLRPEHKCVLTGLGGVAYRPPGPLPQLPGVVWLVPDSWPLDGRPDLHPFQLAGMPFRDVLASCDALVTKVGYGSFVEAAGTGLPIVYLDRPDWPETPWLVSWLAEHARAEPIREAELFQPRVGVILNRLWATPAPSTPDVANAPVLAQRMLDTLSI